MACLVKGTLVCLLLLLLFGSVVVASAGSHPRSGRMDAQSFSPSLRVHRHQNSTNYDEQLGITFTQNLPRLAYNVTAVEQTDPTLGTGPGYLLNGLSDVGFWYQLGISWNWSPGQIPGTGFDMNYEVWDASGNSVFPVSGGGLMSFSGAVQNGNVILLSLQFSNASQVVMAARDLNTSAQAEITFSSEGGNHFVGLPSAVANPEGYFTGLMTEWYHGAPYYTNPQKTVYSNTQVALSSAWMWMEEFNAATDALVFSSSTSAPVIFRDPNSLQEFSVNLTTEYSSAYEFITGAISNSSSISTTTTTISPTSITTSTTTTITSTTTVTATPVPATTAQTATVTITQPVTTIVTSTVTVTAPPSTIISTQTTTQTTTSTTLQTNIVETVPAWAYALMAFILLAGLAIGYLVKSSARNKV